MEASHRGLVHHVGNVAWGNPPRVRISHPPPIFTFCEIVRNSRGRANPFPQTGLFRPAESFLVVLIIWILLEIVSNFVQQTPPKFELILKAILMSTNLTRGGGVGGGGARKMQGNFLIFAHASPRACPRRASLVVRVQFKIHSNFVQYTPPSVRQSRPTA